MGKISIVAVLPLWLAACNTASDQASSVPPPDAKAVVLANKGRFWKDPESIRGASVSQPVRHMGMMWHVCVRLNAKNSFGGYTGEKDDIIGIYDDGRASLLTANGENVGMFCDRLAHAPFPELNGDYRPATARAR